MQQQLQELQLDDQRIVMKPNGRPRPAVRTQQEITRTLNRLRDLARRQEDLNRSFSSRPHFRSSPAKSVGRGSASIEAAARTAGSNVRDADELQQDLSEAKNQREMRPTRQQLEDSSATNAAEQSVFSGRTMHRHCRKGHALNGIATERANNCVRKRPIGSPKTYGKCASQARATGSATARAIANDWMTPARHPNPDLREPSRAGGPRGDSPANKRISNGCCSRCRPRWKRPKRPNPCWPKSCMTASVRPGNARLAKTCRLRVSCGGRDSKRRQPVGRIGRRRNRTAPRPCRTGGREPTGG